MDGGEGGANHKHGAFGESQFTGGKLHSQCLRSFSERRNGRGAVRTAGQPNLAPERLGLVARKRVVVIRPQRTNACGPDGLDCVEKFPVVEGVSQSVLLVREVIRDQILEVVELARGNEYGGVRRA